MNPKRRLRGGYSTNTLSVEFAAKSFFPISPEKKKNGFTETNVLRRPRRRGLPTVRLDGAAIESTAVKQTLKKQKRSIPDQNIQKDVKKNTTRTCLDFLLNQI